MGGGGYHGKKNIWKVKHIIEQNGSLDSNSVHVIEDILESSMQVAQCTSVL